MNSDAREKTLIEALYGLLKIIYAVLGIPFLLLVGIVTLFALNSDRAEANVSGLPLFSMLAWTAIILPVVLFYKGRRAREKKINKILQSLKSEVFFQPSRGFETLSASMGRYFGIDVKNGTILYIHLIRKGHVDVVGMTMKDWTHREIEDKRLRIYTKFVDLPCIELTSYEASRWYDTLGAMEHKRYNTPKPFNEYVSDHVEQLESEHQIHIPKLA